MEITYRYADEEHVRQLKELRREFHRYPEPGFREYRTSGRIAEILLSLGYEVFLGDRVCRPECRMGLPDEQELTEAAERALTEGLNPAFMKEMQGGLTGVIGILQKDKFCPGKGPVIALRFDIDALTIREATGLSFSSLHEGTMHACGHDGHTAVGLTVARILAENCSSLPGQVRLVFQPAEEGTCGAHAIAENGWMEDVDIFLSGHIGLGCKKAGRIQACTGGFMATSKLNMIFRGKAAHAAKNPQDGRNALLAAAEFTVKAAGISKEAADIFASSSGKGLLNVGRFIAGTARNIIADQAYLELDTRGSSREVNDFVERRAREEAAKAAEQYGVSVVTEAAGASIPAVSSAQLVEKLQDAANHMGTGQEYLHEGVMPASEDAAILMDRVQSHGGLAAYYLFGTELKGDHHQSTFDFDEETLSVMTEFYCRAVLEEL